MTRPRTGLALALLLTCALLGGLPAAADASSGSQVVFHAATTPSDPMYGKQWGLENTGGGSGTPFPTAEEDADIDASQAWADGETGSGITVAVVDTRIDASNTDLQPQLVQGATAWPDPVNPPDCHPTQQPDHGTAVAGVVAAAHDTTGVAGVAPGAKILPVPALDDCGGGTLESVKAAFQYAADNGAQIVVASFSTDPLRPLPQDKIDDLDAFFEAHEDTLFVVAAGNEGSDNDELPVYPCSSPALNVVCVGSSTFDDSASCESNVGATSVDLFAPGEHIYSDLWSTTSYHQRVGQLSGTSMAAPMVAGVAALMDAQVPPDGGGGDSAAKPPDPPFRTALELAAALRQPDPAVAVDPRDAMADLSVSGGRLNAAKALGLLSEDKLGPAQGTPWTTCDGDHDDFAGAQDECPDIAGPVHGCPDADGDGVQDSADACPATAGLEELHGCPDRDGDGLVDGSDNCPAVANPGQEDADRDRVGDACDSTPRGPDADGDGFPALDDHCPAQAGTNAGCPVVYSPPPPPPYTPPVVVNPPSNPAITPVVAPRIVSVSVRVAHSRRSARVTVRLSRTFRAKVTVERRVRRHGHRVWSRVLRRSVTFTARGRGMTVRTRARGSYRVTVQLTGAKTVRRNFRV